MANVRCIFFILCLSGMAQLSRARRKRYNDDILAGLNRQNCSIEAIDSRVRDEISLMLESEKKIIFIHLSFKKMPKPFSAQDDLYKPVEWVRTVGRHGRSLLFLRPNFEYLSLTTLSYETGHIEVGLKQSPEDCLSNLNSTDVERKLRELLLSDFKKGGEGGSLSEHEHVCNIHIKNDNSRALFYYQCCHKDPDGNIICQDMVYDHWIHVVFWCISVINIVVILFSPFPIPTSLYRKRYGRKTYEHKLKKPLKIRIIKTSLKPNSQNKDDPIVPHRNLKHMPKFYDWVKHLPTDKVRTLSVNEILIDVPYKRLVAANCSPVSILKTFYKTLFKCHIRKNPSFERCCRGSVWGSRWHQQTTIDENIKNTPTNSSLRWYQILRYLMNFLLYVGLTVPWCLRIYFFCQYEKPHITEQRRAADARNLTIHFQWNLTNALSPFHAIFIASYVMFGIYGLMLLCFTIQKRKQNPQFLRKCLRDMRDISRSKALEWAVLVLLFPCERFGLNGFCLAGLYFILALPVVLVVLAFYFLPTVNLTLRLFAHFVAYLLPRSTRIRCKHLLETLNRQFYIDILPHSESLERPEQMTVKSRCIQLLVLIVCLFSVFSFVLIIMELIIFVVEIGIYSIIGIIMNASHILTYVSLIFMLGLYFRDCFKGVSDTYQDFNKSMNGLIVDMTRDKVEKIASSDKQENTAFQISMEKSEDLENDTANVKLLVKNGIPKWNVHRLILFLDKTDKPYLAEKFFIDTCNMDAAGVPGRLINHLVPATCRFLCICIFLLFVLLVVLAFGDEYQISGTNQMLATLAGGFLPWILSNVLFKSNDVLQLDTNNLSFKSNLTRTVERFQQNWDIADIRDNRNIGFYAGTKGDRESFTTGSTAALGGLDNLDETRAKEMLKSIDEDRVDLCIYDAKSNKKTKDSNECINIYSKNSAIGSLGKLNVNKPDENSLMLCEDNEARVTTL